MKGERGLPGPPGICQCDMEEIRALREEIERLAAYRTTSTTTTRTQPATTTTNDVKISATQIDCGTTVYDDSAKFPTTVTAVRCPNGCPSRGWIWGTGVYTEDSMVCIAAIHDGKIPASGGIVFVKKMPGQESYAGSTQNAVRSESYGSWGNSYKFCNSAQC